MLDSHAHTDKIGLAELGPDLGVLLTSLLLFPKMMSKYGQSPVYQQVTKTLSEQFMPEKGGHGVQDEILFNEILMFLNPPEKTRVLDLLDKMSKGERHFFINTVALWAAKYQKENKKSLKGPDNKEGGSSSSSMEPLSKENPAVKFVEMIATGDENQSLDDWITELNRSGMIQKSTKEKFLLRWNTHQERTGKGTEELLDDLFGEFVRKERLPQVVGPLGYLFAYAMGRGDKVRFIGAETMQSFWRTMMERAGKEK